MPFIVCGSNGLGAIGSPTYRGTCRQRPPYGDGLSEAAEYNRLFHWYHSEGGESGVVRDLAKASRLVELLHRQLNRPEFEVIEVVLAGEQAEADGERLGHDISAAYSYSLLAWGLVQSGQALASVAPAIRALSELLTAHFQPRLNAHGLFDIRDTAVMCNRAMEALQALSPDLFESGEWNFDVVTVTVIRPRISQHASPANDQGHDLKD